MKRAILLLAGMVACSLMSGCLVVGYSSRGGFFVWPGVGVVVVLLLLWLVMRRRF